MRRVVPFVGVGTTAVFALGAVRAFAPRAAPEAPLGTAAECAAYSGVPAGWRSFDRAGMVRVEGGDFEMGSSHGYADEKPVGRVHVDGFWIDRTEVTNAEFAAFAYATRYITEAEREGGAAVFRKTGAEAEALSWWHYGRGASWRHPDGASSDIVAREHEPVVQVTNADARAYAQWLGHVLPTEAQWEFAARGGKDAPPLDQLPHTDTGAPSANFWQGSFPEINTREDGFDGRAPVGCFKANPLGLFDMIGNVWEWTRDPYRGLHQWHGAGSLPRLAPALGAKQEEPVVIKGGSYLCAARFCARYRVTARYPQERHLATPHVGFRTVIGGN
jgi:formylglycine-generating enzyme required for sulfatase activity